MCRRRRRQGRLAVIEPVEIQRFALAALSTGAMALSARATAGSTSYGAGLASLVSHVNPTSQAGSVPPHLELSHANLQRLRRCSGFGYSEKSPAVGSIAVRKKSFDVLRMKPKRAACREVVAGPYRDRPAVPEQAAQCDFGGPAYRGSGTARRPFAPGSQGGYMNQSTDRPAPEASSRASRRRRGGRHPYVLIRRRSKAKQDNREQSRARRGEARN